MPSRKANTTTTTHVTSYARVTSASVKPTVSVESIDGVGIVEKSLDTIDTNHPPCLDTPTSIVSTTTDESAWSSVSFKLPLISELAPLPINTPSTMSTSPVSVLSPVSGKDNEPNFATSSTIDSGAGSSLSAGSSNENLAQDASVLLTSHFPSLEQSATVKTSRGLSSNSGASYDSPNVHHHPHHLLRSSSSSKGANVVSTSPQLHHHLHQHQHQHPQPQHVQQTQRQRNPSTGNNSAPRRNRNTVRRNPQERVRRSAPHQNNVQYLATSGTAGSFTYTCVRCPTMGSQSGAINEYRGRAQSASGGTFSYSPGTLSAATSSEAVSSMLDRGSTPPLEVSHVHSTSRRDSYNYDADSMVSSSTDIAVLGGREYPDFGCDKEVLLFPQVNFLSQLLQQHVVIECDSLLAFNQQSQANFTLLKLIGAVRSGLEEKTIALKDVRLNGGAASHVLDDGKTVYNDIDFIFTLNLEKQPWAAPGNTSTPKEEEESLNRAFDLIRDTFFQVLSELLFGKRATSQANIQTTIQHHSVVQNFINKSVKIIAPNSTWSLFSLVNHAGPNIELKFVHQLARQYEFSMDSFQIVLDSFLDYERIADCGPPMTSQFFSTVVCQSMYGPFREALGHLKNRLIVTHDPSTIRGGGLLKYCLLMIRDFHTINDNDAITMEPYMINRFLADFLKHNDIGPYIKRYMAMHCEVPDQEDEFDNLLTKYKFVTIFIGVMTRSSRIEIDHPSLYTEVQRMALDIYAEMVKYYFRLCGSHDYQMMNKLFSRCNRSVECVCPRQNRFTCVHRLLRPVFKKSQPIVVTYVEDLIGTNFALDSERKQNLAEFVKKHDQEMCATSGGWALAFVPTALFTQNHHHHHHSKSGHHNSRKFEPQSNHYVISASSSCTVPYSALVTAAPSTNAASEMQFDNFVQPQFASCTTYLMTPTNPTAATNSETDEIGHSDTGDQQRPMPSHQVVPIHAQYMPIQEHNLPTFINVLSDIDQMNEPSLVSQVTPSFAFRFAPPLSPPAGFRLCIVNRFPICYTKQIASGPVINSRIHDIVVDDCAYASHYSHLGQPLRSSAGQFHSSVVIPTVFIPPNYQLITSHQPYQIIYPPAIEQGTPHLVSANVGVVNGVGVSFKSDSNASSLDLSMTAASSASSLTESSLYELNKPQEDKIVSKNNNNENTVIIANNNNNNNNTNTTTNTHKTSTKSKAEQRRSRNNSSPAGAAK